VRRRGGRLIFSGGRTDEAYTVAVKVADDEVSSAPRLLLELLVERCSRRDVLGVERFHILDLDEGGNESIPVLLANNEHGLVDEFERWRQYPGLPERTPNFVVM